MKLAYYFLSLSLWLLVRPSFAGTGSITDSTTSYIEAVGLGTSGGRTPFWMHANQYGVVPKNGTMLSTRTGFDQYWALTKNKNQKFQWRSSIGVEAVGNLLNITNAPKPQLLLPQVYGSLHLNNWELSVGRKKQMVGLADSTIGMGSYAWSGNALPIPVIKFGLSQFTIVPMTRGWVAVQGFYADGWFENSRPNTSELKLHQKSLYIRLGTTQSKVRLYGGFNHQVQWGGKSRYNTVDGQMPAGSKNYIYAVTGIKPSNAKTQLDYFDYTNRVGNHLGTVDAAIEWVGKKHSLFLYRQNIYDDGSLFHLNNIIDGLNGIRLRIKNNETRALTVHEVVAELLYTKSQGGTDFGYIRSKQGRDNYFNNSQVWDGWSYYNRTIGTPFIPPSTDTAPLWPSYKFTSNNRVAVMHLGLKGTLLYNYEWSTRLSYSSNSGTYDVPFDTHPKQFSGMLTVQRRLIWLGGNTLIKGSLATDFGELYTNSTGFMLSIRKEGLFINR